MSLLNVLVLL